MKSNLEAQVKSLKQRLDENDLVWQTRIDEFKSASAPGTEEDEFPVYLDPSSKKDLEAAKSDYAKNLKMIQDKYEAKLKDMAMTLEEPQGENRISKILSQITDTMEETKRNCEEQLKQNDIDNQQRLAHLSSHYETIIRRKQIQLQTLQKTI